MTVLAERLSLSVDAIQKGWSTVQYSTTAVFGYDGSTLTVWWSDAGEAIRAELNQAGRLRAFAASAYASDVASWVSMILTDVPASKGAGA